ncbi:MAG: polymer-forming cytoskeletal protein [Candidatus Acidiferrum sp.]
MSDVENTANKHVDEITLLLYVERQLDREAAQEVSLHTQTCARCLTLLRALDRESRLLTRSMLEQDEPLPTRLAEFHAQVKRSMQWLWGVVFGLTGLGAYALYTDYIELWEQNMEQAGFGGTNLLSLLVFQGALWKGWQSMLTLFELVALASVAGLGLFAVRKYLRRGTSLAVVFASVGLMLMASTPISATEFRKAESVQVKKDEVIKSDLFAMGNHIKVEGTVDGDLYSFGEQVEIPGHVMGDVICFCQSLRLSGQVDGNIRGASNNITITGNVDRSITYFSELFTLDSNGKIGHNLTSFSKSLTLDGKLDRDLLAFFETASISGPIGGEMRGKGDSLNISSSASIGGKAYFEGNKPAYVSAEAKLASPLEYKKLEHKSRMERGGGYYVWEIIWASAYLLFGLVLLSILPQFSKDAAANVERVGPSFGLGVLVGFAVPIAAAIACVTVVGLFVGVSALFLWYASLYFAQIIVGAAVGQWIFGKTKETWPFIGRMAVGLVLLRICMAIPTIGVWIKYGVVVIWGIGAISLTIYRRLQPVMAPNIPSAPMGPTSTALPPNTTVGGI